ncbi:sulfotransferase family protein [bacterium]|nr:sulfotransferase family protein [bacterium]
MASAIGIVSGLPRSGTSMMMKMLEAGGLEIITDHVRAADEDNPKGYYEFETVKTIQDDTSWLPDTRGKVFKMVSMLLPHLPADESYKIVFMRRDIDEILRSERKMLERLGKPTDIVDDGQMKRLFEKHLKDIRRSLEEWDHVQWVEVWYNEILRGDVEPSLERVNRLFGGGLNVKHMADVVDPSLYRQKA